MVLQLRLLMLCGWDPQTATDSVKRLCRVREWWSIVRGGQDLSQSMAFTSKVSSDNAWPWHTTARFVSPGHCIAQHASLFPDNAEHSTLCCCQTLHSTAPFVSIGR
eukprot:1211530-Rhodomonas_salina.1